VGEIVALVVDGLDELLLAAALDWREEAGAELVMVAPLSTETEYAAEWDLLLPADDPVGYETIAEVWNHGLVLAEQVSDRLGVLPEERTAELVALWDSYFAPERSTNARVGPPVLKEDDPRVEFQDREQERAAVFFAPTAALLLEPKAGLGTLVAEWRAEHGYNERDLAVELGWNPTLVRSLEDESLHVPPVEVEELARVFVLTGLDLDEPRVAAAAEASARRWTAFAETYDEGAAAARTAGLSAEARERALSRRTGKRRRDLEEHDRAARHFLGELRDAVEDRRSR
jgi:hypothetical protein